ncbi:MAG: FeoB-associated Cys-rich membrane protein [Candidatus Methanoplasma sp.]|jgi:hypothetical protein|nr:FeoB-associated Cys-rich membrane protein [Candidatus Methanoplasma sp.]
MTINLATIAVGIVVVLIFVGAAYSVLKSRKTGGCHDCGAECCKKK